MTDRHIHARLEDDREIVRYDRAGKWYVEAPDHRKPITFGEAVRLARTSGTRIYLNRPGGTRFDKAMRAR